MIDDLRGTSIGYAINLTMKLGDNRDICITGTLPIESTVKDFNKELDKLRTATNRQQALIILRDREIMLESEKKIVLAIELMIEEYEKQIEQEMTRLRSEPLHGTGKMRTQISAGIEALKSQALNFRLNKQTEISTHRGNVENCETIIARMKKEILQSDGANDNEGS